MRKKLATGRTKRRMVKRKSFQMLLSGNESGFGSVAWRRTLAAFWRETAER
jgi:hypothetical protein